MREVVDEETRVIEDFPLDLVNPPFHHGESQAFKNLVFFGERM